MAEPPEVRVGDREREAVVAQLRTHLGHGRLTMEEFEERSGLAFAARTVGDLVPLTADLPAVAPATTTKGPPIRRDDRPPAKGWDLAWQIHYRLAAVLAVAFFLVAAIFWVGWPFWVLFGVAVSVGAHGAVRWTIRG